MATKVKSEETAATRRKEIAEDVAQFLREGNKIKQIPRGVSGQDPKASPGKQLRLAKNTKPKAS